MTRHVMIDIETLGTEPGCVVLSAAAVCVTREDGVLGHFHTPFNVEQQLGVGATVSPRTAVWWAKQGTNPDNIFTYDGGHLSVQFQEFIDWIQAQNADYYWANSPSFDLDILDGLRKCLIARRSCIPDVPWTYKNKRDFRTIRDFITPTPCLKPHDALADALIQAEDLVEFLRLV